MVSPVWFFLALAVPAVELLVVALPVLVVSRVLIPGVAVVSNAVKLLHFSCSSFFNFLLLQVCDGY